MILDELQAYERYLPLHPGFAAAFQALRDEGLATREVGTYSLDGERLKLIIGNDPGVGRENARLEAHRRYIDIQLVLDGDEEMGWRPIADCQQLASPYSLEDDYLLFADPPVSWFRVPPRHFAIFFPADPHAPLAGCGLLHKAVVKVAVEW